MSYYKSMAYDELDGYILIHDDIRVNNISFSIGEAFFGGYKITAQCTVKNRRDEDMNYTLYLACLDRDGRLVASFCLEPMVNVHEAGKLDILEATGLIEEKDTDRIDRVIARMLVQYPEPDEDEPALRILPSPK